MRRLLGAMRDRSAAGSGSSPSPDSRTWSRSSRGREGLPVQLQWRANRFPAPALDLSAYRIVQEALTNVLKHAGASHADVLVRHGTDTLQLEVAMTAAGPRRATTSATGWSASASA